MRCRLSAGEPGTPLRPRHAPSILASVASSGSSGGRHSLPSFLSQLVRGHCKLAATPPFLLRYTSAAASTSATAGSSRVAKKGELELELQLYVMLETPLCVCLILFIFVCAERINYHLEFILV